MAKAVQLPIQEKLSLKWYQPISEVTLPISMGKKMRKPVAAAMPSPTHTDKSIEVI